MDWWDTRPGYRFLPKAVNQAGVAAGAITKITSGQLYEPGMFNAQSPDLDSYRFISSVPTSEGGLVARYLDVSTTATVRRGDTLETLDKMGFGRSDALFINDRGQVAGDLKDVSFHVAYDSHLVRSSSYRMEVNTDRAHAFLYADGAMKDLGTLGGTSSGVSALTARGDVLGWSQTEGNAGTHAFLYTDGRLVDIGQGSKDSVVTAMNERGTLAGYMDDEAFIYRDGALHGLGELVGGASRIEVLAPNDVAAGKVSSNGAPAQIFVYKDGQIEVLPLQFRANGKVMPQTVLSVSVRGDVLLAGQASPYDDPLTFLYSDGGYTDLSDASAWLDGEQVSVNVYDFDEAGRLVGGKFGLKTLTLTNMSVVPEPTSALLMLLGLALMACMSRCASKRPHAQDRCDQACAG
ncbi:MAG: PEP-CTERM sorting domain-containing protein [Aquabacterium sp.]